ncbi:sigma 54-interacting transcriptional regulator, partial [Aeromonas veronii]|nr:sigma 54-interacting transcriptional regulator [Aeromonas veronii]
MSLNTQAKLLRVLQEREIVRVGGTKPIPIDVRIIAATNVNLEKGIGNGTFREDLYYRLNKIPIYIPSLRLRKQDIKPLAEHLLHKINQDYGRTVEGLTDGAINYLYEYDWPGNVRELENVLGRAVIFMNYQERLIDIKHVQPLHSLNEKAPAKQLIAATEIKDVPLTELVEKYEAEVIAEVLKLNGGNKTAAAKSLGISLRSLYYKLEKYNLAN